MGLFTRPDSPYWHLWLETAPPGRQKEKTAILVGTTSEARSVSRALALDLYHRRMNELAGRVHQLARAKPGTTFASFATWYETHVAAHHRGKVRELEIIATLRKTFGPMRLRDLDQAAVLEWRTARLETVSAGTANRELDVLKAMLAAAVPEYLEESPIAGLARVRPPKREPHVLTPAEERRLLAQLEPPDRAIVICALDTLMRLSDVLNLRRDQDRGTYLLVVDPKVEPYKVPVSRRLRRALDALEKDGPYYFAHRRGQEKPAHRRSIIKNMLKRACEAANVKYGRPDGITFHGLRHTAATRLVEGGVPLRVVQALGGWRSMRQLERYAHPSEQAQKDAVELISRHSRLTPVAKRKTRKSA